MRTDCLCGERVPAVCNRRPAEWSADAHVRSRANRTWASGLHTDGGWKPPARLRRADATLGAPQRGAGIQPRVGGAQRSLPWVKSRMDLCPEGAPECAAQSHDSTAPSGRALLPTTDTQGSAARNPGLYSGTPLGHSVGAAHRFLPTGTPQQFKRGLPFSLSQRERAGVRENASLALLCRSFATAVRRSPRHEAPEEDPKIQGRQRLKTPIFVFPESLGSLSLVQGREAGLLPRATGTLLPSLSFHTHQPATHRRTP